MCVVNGKTHLTLDGEPKLNPLLRTIDYPKDAHINADEDQYEGDFSNSSTSKDYFLNNRDRRY